MRQSRSRGTRRRISNNAETSSFSLSSLLRGEAEAKTRRFCIVTNSSSRAARPALPHAHRRLVAGSTGYDLDECNANEREAPNMKWMLAMLVFVPVSTYFHLTHANPVIVFITACLAVIPLAGFMGHAT